MSEDWYFVSHRLQLALAAKNEGYDVSVVCRPSNARSYIESLGIHVIPLRVKRSSLNPYYLIYEILKLTRVYRQLNPEIVHHVAIRPVVTGGIAALFTQRKKVVSAVMGFGELFDKQTFLFRATKFIFWRLLKRSHVIVQNSSDYNDVLRSVQSPKSLSLIRGSGVDTELYRLTKTVFNNPPVVMIASRILWKKGFAQFIAMARQLKAEARFVIVGQPDTDNRNAVPEDTLRQWVDEGVVEWWGHRTDMPDTLSKADIFCLPTFYREGLPKVLLEAMSMNLACVATDIPGCRECIAHERDGFLVEPKNVASLVLAVRELLKDEEKRRLFGANARRRVEELFKINIIIRQTLSVYESE